MVVSQPYSHLVWHAFSVTAISVPVQLCYDVHAITGHYNNNNAIILTFLYRRKVVTSICSPFPVPLHCEIARWALYEGF